ncbi:cobyrinate a,c-diamide synthase [Desulfocurvibacter africanus]|uniref:Cobyrinate a,c-diamide synthase n=1 Tax=Desulfocurvibacter africanus subsp. africanus str. Walvis Bay TaxID=690850 RepID=F3YZL3_DESAF|nr:cobyrinate a,c-diamide synthase [Desulfocurvibacter africanus]EGJ49712.1 Cobyrinic acid A,C-diamide synthase [Desulfocurvibacter africanus subsp. africanus str. Walvis Bay]
MQNVSNSVQPSKPFGNPRMPRVVLAGLSGGSGKTILSLGLCRALARSGLAVRPFKKGPDYIDAKWLGLAARATACNLDPHLMPPALLPMLFADRMAGFDLAVVEGNRGIFDGRDVQGTLSTAELSRQLKAPVILVLDCTKMTRTAAAIVAGIAAFEPGLQLAGVVCNRTAGERHRSILRGAIEEYTDVPVLGMLPKLSENPIPERHMGLWSDQELAKDVDAALDRLADMVASSCDLQAVRAVAESAPLPPVPEGAPVMLWPEPLPLPRKPRIGVVQDAALWFYYPENIEALERAGAEIARVSILSSEPWPELHGLYLGGGFPETHAETLAANVDVRERVRGLSEAGMPVYAECGGFMYLARHLEYQGQAWPMAGVFPVSTRLCSRPQGLGYIEAEAVRDTPFFRAGERIAGHEFHYSACCLDGPSPNLDFALRVERGSGMHAGQDGLMHKRTFAGYTHIHALGTRDWAPNFVRAAAEYAGIIRQPESV